MEGLNGPGKSKTNYPDYEKTDSGLQIKDFKPGSGPTGVSKVPPWWPQNGPPGRLGLH